MKHSGLVKITIYNVLGEGVALLLNEHKAGNYSVKFDGANLPSGIYFYRIEIRDASLTLRMTVTKMVLVK